MDAPCYKDLKSVCRKQSEITKALVEDFLLYYADRNDNLEKETVRRLAPYRHVIRKLPDGWIPFFTSQYIAHRIFRKNGLIHKYFKHSAIKALNPLDLQYLRDQINNPWRYCFSEITGQPAQDFYTMRDVFTGDSFLLYSPGVGTFLTEYPVMLWFNLLSFNGSCWQTFGPISGFQSFGPDDIFFFASEMHPHIESDEDLLTDVQRNPVPYSLLFSGSRHPLIFSRGEYVVQAMAEYDLDTFNTGGLNKDFKVEYARGVYRVTLKRWGGHPHYCNAYYDENKAMLTLFSMTDRGFSQLVSRLNACGYHFSDQPDIRVSPSMLVVAGQILKKKVRLLRYDDLFEKESTEQEKEHLNRINEFLKMATADHNAGREPDIEALAQKAGVDVESARGILEQVEKRLDKLKKAAERLPKRKPTYK